MAKRKSVKAPDKSPALSWEVVKPFLKTHRENGKLRVHSIMGGGAIMMGCDVDLSDVAADAKKYGVMIAGPNMMGLGHGLAIVKPLLPPKDMRDVAIFYEHKPSKKAQIDKLVAAVEKE